MKYLMGGLRAPRAIALPHREMREQAGHSYYCHCVSAAGTSGLPAPSGGKCSCVGGKRARAHALNARARARARETLYDVNISFDEFVI